jgi:hypothetical protein
MADESMHEGFLSGEARLERIRLVRKRKQDGLASGVIFQ